MPNLQRLPDEDLAAALTYIRRSWDHTASPVSPDAVAKVRATPRATSWTERELLKVP
jgi:mono/diheme cytochrome c family protein